MLARGSADVGVVRALWDQPQDGLQVAGPLPGRAGEWAFGSLARTAAPGLRDGRGSGDGDLAAAPAPTVLGAAQAASGSGGAKSGLGLAGGELDRGSVAPRGFEYGPPAARGAQPGVPALPRRRGGERCLERRLQGLVSHRGW